MLDCILDGVIDTIKLIPFLFVTFIILEWLEHKLDNKNQKILINNKKFGPVVGSLLGALPQCGFGAMAASLFSNKVITMGTLIAVFLSTSDEMLPIMISEKANFLEMFIFVLIKIVIGIIVGYIIDYIFKQKKLKNNITHMCEKEHCDCEHDGIILSSLKHSLKISIFILVVNILINMVIFIIGEDALKNILLNKNIISYFIASLFGLIPNCASSVIMTELYMSSLITRGVLLSGLLTGSGIGILLLFKENENKKENLKILGIIYIIGVIVGMIFDLL